MDIFIGIVLIVAAVFLVIAVLLQSGKDKTLSSAIGGSSSDTYYGKNKGNSKDRILNKLTTVVAVVFAVLVVVSFVMQDYGDMKTSYEQFKDAMTATSAADTSESTDAGVDGDGKGTSSSEENETPADTTEGNGEGQPS